MRLKSAVILIVIICAALYFTRHVLLRPDNVLEMSVVMLFSSVKSEQYRFDDGMNLGFSLFEFEQTKIKETQWEHEYDLTAIVQYRKNLSNVKKMVQYLRATQLFKEIIIWNASPYVNLTVHQLDDNHSLPSSLRILDATEDSMNMTVYHVCSQGNTKACYFVNDYYDRPNYSKSLTASFRSHPNVLHFVADARTFLSSYSDQTIDWFTTFSWTAQGSIFLRGYAQQHVRLLDKYAINDRILGHLAHALFPHWFSEISAYLVFDMQRYSSGHQLSTLPNSIPSHLQYNYSELVLRVAERSRRLNTNNSISSNKHVIKSPGFKDDLVFYSNILTGDVHHVWNAVDNNLSTCWQTSRLVRSNDFFAVDFLRSQANITFLLTISHKRRTQAKLDVSMSFNGIWWIPYRSLNGIFIQTSQPPSITYLFHAAQFNQGFRSFRYVKFQATDNSSTEPLIVCDIRRLSTEDSMRDFQPLTL